MRGGPGSSIPDEKLQRAKELYEVERKSSYQIARLLGLKSPETLREALKSAGVQMRQGSKAQRENRKWWNP